ncbi:hypothetical protein AVEN_249567-1 [Araneus ventricosus]|uniref:Uncharacterized protein n=1 Tax=Araneus ventricosus TaxID=182803 RepID=A0A4Y2KL56_ARAVE|nr:hypothetical protein AVEN_249567-1 [Araneus ventricosus]
MYLLSYWRYREDFSTFEIPYFVAKVTKFVAKMAAKFVAKSPRWSPNLSSSRQDGRQICRQVAKFVAKVRGPDVATVRLLILFPVEFSSQP